MQNHQPQRRMPQESQPQREEGTQEKNSSGVNNPHVFSPTNILRLQRTIGNQAVLRMAHRKRPHIQRDPESENETDIAASFGNVYEQKFEIKEDRYSFSVAMSFSRRDTSPLKGETESGLAGQIGEMKVSNTVSKGTYSAAQSLALALFKGSYEVAEPIPGVTFKYELKALEAKLELVDLKSSVDADVFKVAASADGALTPAIEGYALGDAILATSLGDLIRSGTPIKITLKGEVKIDPSDAARLVKMFKTSQEIARNGEAAVKIARQQQALLRQNNSIWRQLSSDLSKAEKNRLRIQFAKNRIKLIDLGRKLAGNAENTKALREVYKTAADALGSKLARVWGMKIAAVAARFLTKALPVAGWLLTLYDVGTLLYEVYKGAQSDFEQSGGAGGENGEAGGGESGAPSNDMTDDGPSETGSSEGDANTSSGGVSEGGASLPDVDIGGGLRENSGVSEPNGSLPNVTDSGGSVNNGELEPNGSLPSVMDLGDDQSSGGSERDEALPSVTDSGDEPDSGMNGTGAMPEGEVKDKANIEEIIAGIRHHKDLMETMDQTHYLGLPADCKGGETYHKWFFWYGSDQVHAAYTKVTILKRKGNRVAVKLAPSSVYLEDGTFLPNDFEGDTMKMMIQHPEN